MRELVIVITDLYEPGATSGLRTAQTALPGIEYAGRFGARARLARGWRPWLAGWVGRPELAAAAVAEVAAAAVVPEQQHRGSDGATLWIATPVELTAGLARVHLDPRGMLHLAAHELAGLAADFHGAFGASGLSLRPLADGSFLLRAPGIAPVATLEPARCAGAEVAVAQGPAAAPLLRLAGEIEMWLHGAALNEARRGRGERPVTALWLWGADRVAPASASAPRPGVGAGRDRAAPAVAAFGSDAYLCGLWHLLGGESRREPASFAAVLEAGAERAVLVVEAVNELQGDPEWSVGRALAELDRRAVGPALQALRDGALGELTLVANDCALSIGRRAGLKRWRRPRPGITGLA